MKSINSVLQKKIKKYVEARSSLTISRRLLLDEQLHPYSKIVYLVLCSFMQNNESTVTISQKKLIKHSRLSQSSISRSLLELKANKLVSIIRQGFKKPNIYKIL